LPKPLDLEDAAEALKDHPTVACIFGGTVAGWVSKLKIGAAVTAARQRLEEVVSQDEETCLATRAIGRTPGAFSTLLSQAFEDLPSGEIGAVFAISS